MFDTFVKSKLGYANPGWQPFLSDSNMEQLEVIQRKAARQITGQYKATHCDILFSPFWSPLCEVDPMGFATTLCGGRYS